MASDPYLLVPQADAGVVGACRPDSELTGWGMFPRFDGHLLAYGVVSSLVMRLF